MLDRGRPGGGRARSLGAEGADVLHRRERPRAERARAAGGDGGRAPDQGGAADEDLRLPRASHRGRRRASSRRRASTATTTTSTPARDHHARITTTHTYDDRVRTIEAVKRGGHLALLRASSPGMGETDEQIVDVAFALRELDVDSIPVNFLNADPGHAARGRGRARPAPLPEDPRAASASSARRRRSASPAAAR